MSNIILEELARQSIFVDESKFSLDHIPPKINCRDKELRQLASFFRNLVLHPNTFKQTVLIQGSTGSGKTVLIKYFGREFEKAARNQKVNLKYLHLNCRKLQSEASLLTTILKHLVPYFPPRGFGGDELLRMLAHSLEQQDMHLLLALDEIDFIIRRGAKDLLYHLRRFDDDSPSSDQRLSLILITSDYTFKSWIDPRARSLLTQNLIVLDRYDRINLCEILNTRITGGFQPGAVPSEIIEQIAEIAEEEQGNARVAIELLWLAGKRAEQAGATKIHPEHVRESISEISSSFGISKDMLRSLPQQKLILLLSIVRTLLSSENTSLSLAQVREAYALLCEQNDLAPRQNTQLYYYCRDLSSLGLIKIAILNKDIPGRISRISVKVPLKPFEEQLSEILARGRDE